MLGIISSILWLGAAIALNHFHPNPSQPIETYIQKLRWQRNALIVLLFLLPVPLLGIFNWFVIDPTIYASLSSGKYFLYAGITVLGFYLFAVTPKTYPMLDPKLFIRPGIREFAFFQQIVHTLSNKIGVQEPECYILNYLLPHGLVAAAASRYGYGQYFICIDIHSVRTLDKAQLWATVAHEISHIKHNDLQIMHFTDPMAALIRILIPIILWCSYATTMLLLAPTLGNLLFVFLAAILVSTLFPYASTFIRNAISRKQEHMADAYAVSLVGKEAMWKIAKHLHDTSEEELKGLLTDKDDTEHYGKMANWFSTHPYTGTRIDIITRMKYPSRIEDLPIYDD